MSKQTAVLMTAVATLAFAIPARAQQRSTVSASTLDAAVTAPVARSNRTIVSSALTTRQALSAAASMGLSADDVSARIARLDEASAAKVAEQLAGGDDKIVISTTAVIIGLLLLILLTR